MYCPDTYQRLNEAKVREYQEQLDAEAEAAEEQEEMGKEDPLDPDVERTMCEFCNDSPATQVIPVYNPADRINGRGQDAYAVYYSCDECAEDGAYMEENFYCDKCGELFIVNHSWEILAVMRDDGTYCQQCAADEFGEESGLYLCDLLDGLDQNLTHIADLFLKLDNLPGKDLLWSGEFSEWPDFPGYTSFKQVADGIRKAAEAEGVSMGDMVWPVVNSGRQFSVTLEVYY